MRQHNRILQEQINASANTTSGHLHSIAIGENERSFLCTQVERLSGELRTAKIELERSQERVRELNDETALLKRRLDDSAVLLEQKQDLVCSSSSNNNMTIVHAFNLL